MKEADATLSGTFCGMVYRNIGGKQHAHLQLPTPLPKNATAADKARQRKQQVVMWAVGSIQMMLYEQGQEKSVRRMQELADQYNTFHHHAVRKYEEWRERFTDDRGFARAIAYWYVTKQYPREFPELAVESREHRTPKED